MATTNISIRVDTELKKQAESMLSDMGLNMTTAMNIFLRQVVRQGKIPFEIATDIPNAETIEAISEFEEFRKNPNGYKRYASFSELLDEVNADA